MSTAGSDLADNFLGPTTVRLRKRRVLQWLGCTFENELHDRRLSSTKRSLEHKLEFSGAYQGAIARFRWYGSHCTGAKLESPFP